MNARAAPRDFRLSESDVSAFDDYKGQLQAIDLEIGRLALLCGVQLERAGAVEAILGDDTRVCQSDNRRAWEKLRGLLVLHFHVVAESASSGSAKSTQDFVREVAESVRKRIQFAADS